MSDGDPLYDSTPRNPRQDLEVTLALVDRLQQGDRSAAGEVFKRYEERIRRIVRVRLGARLRRWVESGDLVQETCRSALESLPKVQLGTEFDLLDYLARVATNRIRDHLDYLQAERRDIGRVASFAENEDGPNAQEQWLDSARSPSQEAAQLELRALLDEILATLPDSYREVVLLRDYEGADWTDVARSINAASVHAAQQLYQRAWLKIKIAAAPRLARWREA